MSATHWVDEPIPPELACDVEPLDEQRLDDDLARMDSVDLIASGARDPAEVQATDAENPVRSWRIEDEGAAEWAMRKLAVEVEKVRRLEERRDAWAQKIAGWFESAARSHRRRVRFFEAHLEGYALRRRRETGHKSLALPSGAVRTRGGGPKLIVRDEDAFRSWALENPDSPLVRLKAELVAAETGKDKLLRPERVEVERELHLTLEGCGHVEVIHGDAVGEMQAKLAEGSGTCCLGRFGCRECHPDPVDGPPRRTVVSAEVVGVLDWRGVTADGEVVSWAAVEQPEPTAKAIPS